VGATLGVLLGVVSAVKRGALGRFVDVLSLGGWVLPSYWLAAELVALFAIKFQWFPAIGYVPLSQSPVGWLRSLALPVLALSLGAAGGFAKFTRDAMLDALGSEYVRMARANGVSQTSIIYRHAFKSASLQVVTLGGLLIVGLLVGTVFVETIFALPGLGSLMVNSVNNHDVPMVQGIAVFFTMIVIAVNLTVDLAYSVLSPKVRAS
jgi:peptide/nickel transport system permease protein